MGCFMNILWLMFGGIITAVEYLIASLLMMFTIIGIPFGMQTLKMASLALWPFGKEVRSGERSNGCLYVLMNILWIFLGGIWICLSHLGFGLLLCITIIGIPFGIQHFKLAGLALTPFGKDIVAASSSSCSSCGSRVWKIPGWSGPLAGFVTEWGKAAVRAGF